MSTAERLRSIFHLGYPIYLELLSNIISGFVDAIWVAGLGRSAVAGVTLATNLENVAYGLILAVSTGLTVLLAKQVDPPDVRAAGRSIRSGTALGIGLSIAVGALGFFLRRQLAGLFGAGSGSEAIAVAASFLAVALGGIGALYGQNLVNALFKAQGDTRTPMAMAILANLLNLILAPLLVYGLAGLPELGATGSAWALVISRTAALLCSLALASRSPLVRAVRADRALAADWVTAKAILRLGWPTAGEFLVRMAGNMAMVSFVAGFGATALAGYGIGYKILLFVTMAFYALRQANTIYTARQVADLGRGDLPLIGRVALGSGLAVALIAVAILGSGAPWLVSIFGSDAAVLDAAVSYIHYMCLYLLPLGCLISLTGVFIGAGRSEGMFHITLLGVLVQVVGAIWLQRVAGLAGVWWAMILSNCLQVMLLVILYRSRLLLGPEGRSPLTRPGGSEG
ncbi:MAG: MATE family efflux transporter [Bacillota bacterium]